MTVFHGKRAYCWKTTPRSGPGPVIVLPSKRICPASGMMIPAMQLSRVVLPDCPGPSHQKLVLLDLQRDVVQNVDSVLFGDEALGDVPALDFYVRSLRHGQTTLSNRLRITASEAPMMPMMIMPTMIMGGLYMSMPWMIR